MKIIPFIQWHLTVIGSGRVVVGPELFSRMNLAVLSGPVVTVTTDDDIILATVGCIFVTRGCVEVWAVVSPKAKEHAFALAKGVNWCFAESIRRYGIRRFQAAIAEHDLEARRWAESFHMKPEHGAMDDFGDYGEPFIRYVKRLRP